MIEFSKAKVKLLQSVVSNDNDNVDAVVTLPTGESRTVTFFTLKNISSILAGYAATGECLSGKFFWAKDMVIVRDLSRATIEAVVAEMIQNGEYDVAFGHASPSSLQD
ncbi:MAG: hypothetical protein IPO95_07475 [Rhodanobacteraceae bacterium]|nr:hypothetical protein [Rhodanobacteraceae bacterium]